MSGHKKDEGKLRYDLIPAHPLQELAYVYTIGAKKYGDNNWRSGIAYSRIIAALMRHLEAWRMGRTVDPDDGQHPLASVAWCALTLMEYENTRPEFDDRGGKVMVREDMIRILHSVYPLDRYIPGEPCPECGRTCSFPEKHTERCCACYPGDYGHPEDPSARRYRR